ncbi:hypothetical protein IWW34DRAFT_812107 [Fusarium oxysporum f. sp. albedinis]|nr:hypothetical protein IWW34DRAFT_812107 [Fusarium oxysporum f. sp. albedinis]
MAPRSIRTALLAFMLLFLLSLIESINDTTISAGNPHWRPGFWDAGTTRVIVTQLSILSPILVTGLSQRSSHRYGFMAGNLCLTTDGLGQPESGSVADPLLSTRWHSRGGSSRPDDGVTSFVAVVKICLRLKQPPRDTVSALGSWIFLLIAIPQASRPLFATYTQQRCGLSPTEADNLWLLRSETSMFIFGVLLLCLMFIRGVILMALGAIVIGVSGSSLDITIGSCFLDSLSNFIDNNEGLIINTFGVSLNRSLLCFGASYRQSSAIGPDLMSVALFESVGPLVGIAITYPIYQWSIDEKTPFYAGSLLYVLRGTKLIYAAIAVALWR